MNRQALPRGTASDRETLERHLAASEPLMREYEGRAVLYGEAAAQAWLAAQFDRGSVRHG